MDRLAAMYAFRAVVDHGGYAAAARALGRSKTALSKAVSDLESHLGVRLLQRSTRQISVTEAGRRFHARCVQLLADLEDTEGEARDAHGSVRGHIRMVAPQTFGELYLVPLLAQFLNAEPGVSLELMLLDRFVDLVEERFDIAVRIADLADSSLVAKRLGDMRLVVCASPAYLARHGTPGTPEALGVHDCIVDTNMRAPRLWTFEQAGIRTSVAIHGRLAINNATAVRVMALEGHGIALCPDFVIAPDLAEGSLVRLLENFDTAPRGIHVVYPHRRHLARRLRALIDFLSERLEEHLPLQSTGTSNRSG
jgi:DNA-binding transcriptional LysR family regulator